MFTLRCLLDGQEVVAPDEYIAKDTCRRSIDKLFTIAQLEDREEKRKEREREREVSQRRSPSYAAPPTYRRTLIFIYASTASNFPRYSIPHFNVAIILLPVREFRN